MTLSPAALPRNLRSALLAFALTLGVAGAALWTGAAADALALLQRTVDTQVVLLFVPLCALVFAITIEVVRMAAADTLPSRHATPRRLPRGWETAQD